MNAAIWNDRWNPWPHPADTDLARFPAENRSASGNGAVLRQPRCPLCDSIVYSRRHPLCAVCGESLPDGCLFTAAEAASVETLLRSEQQRHRAWLKKVGSV